MSPNVRRRAFWHVRPTKSQISLRRCLRNPASRDENKKKQKKKKNKKNKNKKTTTKNNNNNNNKNNKQTKKKKKKTKKKQQKNKTNKQTVFKYSRVYLWSLKIAVQNWQQW